MSHIAYDNQIAITITKLKSFHSSFSISSAILKEGIVLPILYYFDASIPILEGEVRTERGIINTPKGISVPS